MRRAVITGLGIVSSLGNSQAEVADALRAGRSGVHLDPQRKELGFRSALTGVIRDYELPPVPKRNLRQMGQSSYLAIGAAAQAIAEAELDDEALRDERTGIVVGNDGNMAEVFDQCHNVFTKSMKLGGNAITRAMTSSVSANLSVLHGTRGHALTIAAACASGAIAIAQSVQLIRLGMQDRVLCGGVQEGSWQVGCQFDALRAFSLREHEPSKASRPFDEDRDGLVPSCGSGMVVLEDYDAAIARGAKPYAEVIGYAVNSDGEDMTVPTGDGARRCLSMALDDAAIPAASVDYINAHATSTIIGDRVEAEAIADIFGNRPWVSSTKSMTGHEIGAAGSNELIYTLMMMRRGFVAPSINLDKLDSRCAGIRIAANVMQPADIRIAVSNSFGFGGVNSCLVIRRLDVDDLPPVK